MITQVLLNMNMSNLASFTSNMDMKLGSYDCKLLSIEDILGRTERFQVT